MERPGRQRSRCLIPNKSNGPESNQQERKEGKEEGEKKKLSILMFLYLRL